MSRAAPRASPGVLFALALALAVAALVGALAGGAARGQPRGGSAGSDSGAPRDAGRSLVVYPAQTIRIRMNHALEAHATLACTRCHERARESAVSADSLLPPERACAACHAETDRDAPSVERCGFCHVGAGLAARDADAASLVGRIFIPASRLPAPRLAFSHRRHGEMSGGCVRCHAGIERAGLGTRAHLPTMRTCLECHAVEGLGDRLRGGTSREGLEALRCTACHEALADGRVRSRFAEGTLTPPAWMAGMEHDGDWLVRHRWIAADAGPLCASCHVERDCTACHDARERPRRVHPGDFLTTHPTLARRDETRCASCHSIGTFCAECHARLGLATFSAPATRGGLSPHPPRALWSEGPNLHGIEATRSLSSCVSCHAETDCTGCHASGRVGGGGVSPHPPGFSARCAGILDATPTACARCHGDVASLRARCR